jgi:hypothetical protein
MSQTLVVSLELAVSAVSAIVALGSALITAILGARATRQQLELTAEIEGQEVERRKREQREDLMSRIRDPFLQAAFDLQMRIFNIIDQRFLVTYLRCGSDDERTYARNSTVFLLAQYMGWVEIVRRNVQFLELGDREDNRNLVNCLSGATGILSSDSFMDGSPDSNGSPLFRVFRSDQRAIGEIMIDASFSDGASCIGYASFCTRVENDKNFHKWLSHLYASIEEFTKGEQSHPRLVALQHNLIDLISILDPGEVRFPGRHRNKLKSNPLTSVEVDILAAAGAPESLTEIAMKLGVTRESAEYRLQTLLQKLSARSGPEARAKATEEGMM